MVTSHETIDTFNAVVDIAIGTCLFTIAPNFNIVTVVCQSDFATDRSWRFFSATIIGTERSEDVVKSYDPGIKAKVLRVVTTDALHVELFPAVAVFRVSWISILFSQRRGVGFFNIDAAHPVAPLNQILREMVTNESTSAGNKYSCLFCHVYCDPPKNSSVRKK